jgi:hypothetical protein
MSDVNDADLEDELEEEIEEEEPEDEEDELEPEESEEEPSEEDEPEPAAARQSRGEKRVQAATRTAAEAKRKAEALEAELNALKAAQNRQPSESADQRRARLEAMEPWERTELLTNERLARLEIDSAERLDKLAFQTLCASDPVAAGMKDDVERELAALRARGQNVDRDTMLTFLLGQRARANGGRATTRAKKAAQANRERQQARPGASRSDTPAADRREANSKAARDKRLADYQL